YRCADGNVMFAIQNDRDWRRFCTIVLERKGLADDPRFASNPDRLTNRVELESLIESAFAESSVAVVVELLERAEIANAVVNDMQALNTHQQLAERQRWTEVESFVGPIPALVPPHNIAGVVPR